MSYPSRGFNCHNPNFTENVHLLYHGWQPAGQLFGQKVHNKRRWLLQQHGAGRFSNQGYRPRDKIFVHGGEEILVSEPFSLCSDDSAIGNLEISNHILGPRRTLPKHDADHRAYRQAAI
jgi:hypothetical protein